MNVGFRTDMESEIRDQTLLEILWWNLGFRTDLESEIPPEYP